MCRFQVKGWETVTLAWCITVVDRLNVTVRVPLSLTPTSLFVGTAGSSEGDSGFSEGH